MKHSILLFGALAMTSVAAISTASAMKTAPGELVLDEAPAESPEELSLAAEADPDGERWYNPNALEVKKTAETTFERRWKWKLDKTSDLYDLYLARGESKPVEYKITAAVDGYEDSGWAVSGEIKVTNKTYYTATITKITDVLTASSGDPIYVDVDCDVYFPYSLKPGQTLKCTYYEQLSDGQPRTNKAIVETKGYVEGGTATAPVKFDSAKQEVDRCADVRDITGEKDLGKVCVEDAPKTWKIWLDVGYYDMCGEHHFTNYAELVTRDTYTVEEASHTIKVKVKCDGCTRTQGYWKTHSTHGPAAKPDPTWDLIGGPDTPFYSSGKSWLELFNTPPKGNAYIILAHQYMAAVLNGYAGADTSYVKDEMEYAKNFFENTTMSADLSSKKREDVLSWANILDKYNNGQMGADHCD